MSNAIESCHILASEVSDGLIEEPATESTAAVDWSGPVCVCVQGVWCRATLCYRNENDQCWRLTLGAAGGRLVLPYGEERLIRLDARAYRSVRVLLACALARRLGMEPGCTAPMWRRWSVSGRHDDPGTAWELICGMIDYAVFFDTHTSVHIGIREAVLPGVPGIQAEMDPATALVMAVRATR